MNRQELEQILKTAVSSAGFSLFDFQPAQVNRGVLRVFVFRNDRESPLPALDDCSAIARSLLDHPLVEQFIPGDSTLEVSTPGVNRALKTVSHFMGAIGERVRVKWRPSASGATANEVSSDSSEGGRLKAATVSQVDVGVVTEVVVEAEKCEEAASSDVHQFYPIVLLKPEGEFNRARNRKKIKNPKSSKGQVATEQITRIPLLSIVEAHVDFKFD